jgi:rare lipoprotein A
MTKFDAIARELREHRHHLSMLCVAALLAACASGPPKSSSRDGPEAKPPPDLARVPDAQPQVEPIRPGGPNKPYEVLGKDYTPQRDDSPLTEKGLASWYGRKFHGKRTASGEVYNMYAMTAAHKTMPIPSYARVRNPANGREVIVRVNDRGPFHPGRVIDLSYTAALKLGVLNGVAPVEVERITFEQIRAGSWRRDGGATEVAAAPAPAPTPAPLPSPLPAAVSTPLPVPVAAVPIPELPAASAPDAPVDPKPSRAFTTAAQGFWVQLGAFKQRDGAEEFQRRVSGELDWLAPLLAVFSEPSIFRLQAGPYPSRGEAQDAAARIREALKLVPLIVERR